jgi:hypothetical protein
MNNMRTVASKLLSLRRIAVLGVSLALAACGSSQNWDGGSQFVTIRGGVSGFTGGDLALWNNGRDRLAISGNGTFRFPLQIASGSSYAVVVATQPAGQTCTVTNGTGTAPRTDVTSVTVTCVPYTFTRRALPTIYSTGKAVNYSPYRTAGGPITLEVPSDAEILQDLTLLDLAGFNLLRLFGARAPATDVVAEKILRIAAQNFPDMRFQLGVELKGLTTCSDPANDFNIAYLISNLSKYPNVVTISVGNETSFFSRFMPLPCLEGYIRTIRSQVTQPVTADDDWTFYAGKATTESSERVPVKPDTILPLLDFASIHMYPISYAPWDGWDWRQTDETAGPERAKAMMEQSLVALKEWYGDVVDYQYVGADGVTVSVGDSMPITVGETGWKARKTNPALELEFYAARPENAKWYFDLLYGNPETYPAWQGSAGGPPTIFYFQTFDEQWKGIDDGWGLWDLSRQARYALCGLPAGPACKPDVYEGAGYYDPPPFSTITFDSSDVDYTFLGFAGAEDSGRVTDPAGGTNMVARVRRSAETTLTFAGTVVGTVGPTVGIVPLTTTDTRMTVRVYSPAAGIPVRLKLVRSQDDPNNPSNKVETEVLTTVANAWETLTFDFATPAPGTPPLNTSLQYNQLIIFFNFGKTGAQAGAQTFYFDDVTFIGGGGLPSVPFVDLSFDSPGTVYTLTGFGGAEDSSLKPDPTNASNTTVRVVRSATAEIFAGTVVSTGPGLTVGTIPFTATDTRMTVRVYSPAAGITVRLKAEDATAPSCPSCPAVESEAVTTVANAWETLTFNFANPVGASLDLALNYNRLIIFFDFGLAGSAIGARTYYFDDMLFIAGGGGGGSCGTTAPDCAPTTVIPADAVTIYSDAASRTGLDPFPDWGQSPPVTRSEVTIAGNKSLQYVWAGPGGLYQGIDWASNPVDVSAKGKLHIDFWTPDLASVKVSLISAGLENAYTQALTTGGWNSVDIDLSNYTVPNLANIIQIKLEPNGPGTLYVDNIYFGGTGSGSTACTGGTFTGGVFAADYRGSLNPADAKPPLTTLCGDIGFFYDPRFAVGSTGTALYDFGGVSPQASNPGGVPNFYYGFGLKLPAITNGYFGAYVNAPANGIADVTPFTDLRFTLWGPAELFEKSFTPQIQVVMAGPVVGGCGSNSRRSEIQAPLVTALKIGAASNFVVPLSSFTLKFACSGETTVAEVLAKVAQVNFSLIDANIQYSVPDPNAPTAYPNGLNVGPISFQ